MDKLRIIFAGTPDFARHHLQALIDSDHEVAAVCTQPDRPAGRGKKLTPSPVKQLAQTHGLTVFQPRSLKTDTAVCEQLAALQPDLMVVVAYGLILPKAVLEIPRFGCINVHASLLPRWRGAAPIQRAILADDTESGVAIMQMDEGLDTGDVLVESRCPIGDSDTSEDLHDRLVELGRPTLIHALDAIASGSVTRKPQDDSKANYADKIEKKEAVIDWHRSAPELDRLVRAFNPWPVAASSIDGTNVRIWSSEIVDQDSQAEPGTVIRADKNGIVVSTGEGALNLTRLQLSGGRAMSAGDLLNSRQSLFTPGKVFN